MDVLHYIYPAERAEIQINFAAVSMITTTKDINEEKQENCFKFEDKVRSFEITKIYSSYVRI